MNVRKRILQLIGAASMGLVLALGAGGAASGSVTTQITNNGDPDEFPAIPGSNVVWYAQGGGVPNDYEIYLARGAPPRAWPVPAVSFGGLALLAGLVLVIVAWARRTG